MNDINNIKQIITHRRSIGKLSTPAPSIEEIKDLLTLAMTAPDHKQLKPWRFVLLTGDQLDKFGQVLCKAAQKLASDKGDVLDDNAQAKFINMPKRAPMILVAISDYQQHPKVPIFEQDLSMGACIQNFLLLLTAYNYQSIWRTGELIDSECVRLFFDVKDNNKIAGFIYIGTSDIIMPERKAVAVDQFLTVY